MNTSRWSAPILGACLLAGTLVLSPLAQAGPAAVSEAGVPTKVVRFHDLDLNSAQGVQALYGRIRRAADEVCAPFGPVGTLARSAAWYSCFGQAIATAVRRVDSPLLTAYYQRQQGQVLASAQLVTTARQ